MGPQSGGRSKRKRKQKQSDSRLVDWQPISITCSVSLILLTLSLLLLLLLAGDGKLQSVEATLLDQQSLPKNEPLRLSHAILCEPLNRLTDLKLKCTHEQQFIVILEAYYSDLYPEIACPRVNSEENLGALTGSQLVSIFRQLYSHPASPGGHSSTGGQNRQLIKLNPTLSESSSTNNYTSTAASNNAKRSCYEDLRQSFRAKCSGRQHCRFIRATDHQFPSCATLKPGHVFLRYLCIDQALLISYCNADALLASHSSVLNRVRRDEPRAVGGLAVYADLPRRFEPGEQPAQVDTPDFGFVASPGYPDFYATPSQSCGWTIEAELNQRITIKLLDASLAPHELKREPTDYTDDQLTTTSTNPTVTSTDEQQQQVMEDNNVSSAESARILFKINQHDYEALKAVLSTKLEQVAAQCLGYDQLLLLDSSLVIPQQSNSKYPPDQLELISQLPITLYKNHLIDFHNKTIYKTSSSSFSHIDYTALVNSLNPLQLIWLYQHNISFCSIGQQDLLSAPHHKQRISFTSTGNTIQLNLVTGYMFNPTNRGVLFWFHKHGCPATLRAPKRSRFAFRNETVEIFRCFEGFVFEDTRQTERVRICHSHDQLWRDLNASPNSTDNIMPNCVYIEELALSNSIGTLNSDSHDSSINGATSAAQRALTAAQEVAVEVVGVFPPPTPPFELVDEVLASTSSNRQQHSTHHSASGNSGANATLENLLSEWYGTVLDYMALRPDQPGSNPNRKTHQPLREQRLADPREHSLWSRASALFDRRLLAPAITVLFLFILINFVIYVIFLVALPKFTRLLFYSRCAADSQPARESSSQQSQIYFWWPDNKKDSHKESR